MKQSLSLVVVVLLLAAGSAQAQQGKYVNSASARLVKLIDSSNTEGYAMQDNSFSAGGGWLKKSTDWVPLYSVKLVAGKQYRFLAVGDMDAKDVDLQITNVDGSVVASDTAVAPEAIVNYRPTASGTYTVRVRVYASKDSVPSFVLSMMMSK